VRNWPFFPPGIFTFFSHQWKGHCNESLSYPLLWYQVFMISPVGFSFVSTCIFLLWETRGIRNGYIAFCIIWWTSMFVILCPLYCYVITIRTEGVRLVLYDCCWIYNTRKPFLSFLCPVHAIWNDMMKKKGGSLSLEVLMLDSWLFFSYHDGEDVVNLIKEEERALLEVSRGN